MQRGVIPRVGCSFMIILGDNKGARGSKGNIKFVNRKSLSKNAERTLDAAGERVLGGVCKQERSVDSCDAINYNSRKFIRISNDDSFRPLSFLSPPRRPSINIPRSSFSRPV